MKWLMLLLLLAWPLQVSGQTTDVPPQPCSAERCAMLRDAAILNAAAADKCAIILEAKQKDHAETRLSLVKAKQVAMTPTALAEADESGRTVLIVIGVAGMIVGAGAVGYLLGRGSHDSG